MRPFPDLSRLTAALLGRPARSLLDGTSGEPSPKTAAVAIILRDGPNGIECLLIRRAERAGDPWSGQMALPGGRREPFDVDLVQTAVRETREEVGLVLQREQRIAALDDVEASARGRRTGLVVRPLVFRVDALKRPSLAPNEEVAETLWCPLQPIHRGDWDTVHPYAFRGQTWKLPAWDVQGRVVWGLTHQILSDLLSRI